MLPCFMHAIGRSVNRIEYQVVAAALHEAKSRIVDTTNASSAPVAADS